MISLASHEVLQKWFSSLDSVLREEAELSGLLGHTTMTGNAREFLVQRVLKTVLPPSVHIGTGVIIGQESTRTKQIDVVLYDSEFPVLETQEGCGLYFAEGVMATIEVKSKLTSQTLDEALGNCVSVGELKIATRGVNETHRVREYKGNEYLYYAPPPCTYVFSFQGPVDHRTLGKHIDNWWAHKDLTSDDITILPELIAAGDLVCYRTGRWVTLGAEGEIAEKMQESSGPNAVPVMGVWKTESRFGHLISNLLFTVRSYYGVKFDRFDKGRTTRGNLEVLSRYLPMDAYVAEINADASTMVSCPGNPEI